MLLVFSILNPFALLKAIKKKKQYGQLHEWRLAPNIQRSFGVFYCKQLQQEKCHYLSVPEDAVKIATFINLRPLTTYMLFDSLCDDQEEPLLQLVVSTVVSREETKITAVCCVKSWVSQFFLRT